jgi:hypothetical protein
VTFEHREHGSLSCEISIGDQISRPSLLPNLLQLTEMPLKLLSTGFGGLARHHGQALQLG